MGYSKVFSISSPKKYVLAVVLIILALAAAYFSPQESSPAPDLPKNIYAKNCMRCHGDQLQGGIGPNLIDPTWIFGDGSAPFIAHVITEGSMQMGMPAWKHMLTESEINDLALWIASQQGKHVEQK
jgi:aldose sugar dehydrogenase